MWCWAWRNWTRIETRWLLLSEKPWEVWGWQVIFSLMKTYCYPVAWRFFRRGTGGTNFGLVVCNFVWKKCKKAFLSVFNVFALFGTRVLTSHWCTQLPKCILHHAYMAHGVSQESMATLGDTSGSNAKLPVESRILIFGPWHQAIRTISSTKNKKMLELCCPYNSFFLISICFLLPLWSFQVILLAPIIDFSLVQASGNIQKAWVEADFCYWCSSVCPFFWPMTLLFRQKRNVLFLTGAHWSAFGKNMSDFITSPKRHTVCYTSYPWRKTPEQWKLPLSPSWLIQSFSDPWLARNFVIFGGQTLRLQKVPITNKSTQQRGQPDIVMIVLENVPFCRPGSLPCLFLNFTKASQMLPLRRKTYVSSLILFGPLLTVLKSVLESAPHSSIFQSVPNCVFVPNPQKKTL